MALLMLLLGMNTAQAAQVQFCVVTEYGSVTVCFMNLSTCQSQAHFYGDNAACVAMAK